MPNYQLGAGSQAPKPANEKALSYAPGSEKRQRLKEALRGCHSNQIEIPLVINGREVFTGVTGKCVIPHDRGHILATYHMAGPKEIQMAIDACLSARKEWEGLPWEHRVRIFLKAGSRNALQISVYA